MWERVTISPAKCKASRLLVGELAVHPHPSTPMWDRGGSARPHPAPAEDGRAAPSRGSQRLLCQHQSECCRCCCSSGVERVPGPTGPSAQAATSRGQFTGAVLPRSKTEQSHLRNHLYSPKTEFVFLNALTKLQSQPDLSQLALVLFR